MDFSAIINALLEIATKITALTGEFEASAIINVIKSILEKLDLNAIFTAITSLFAK